MTGDGMTGDADAEWARLQREFQDGQRRIKAACDAATLAAAVALAASVAAAVIRLVSL